jgi:hypothetical protein
MQIGIKLGVSDFTPHYDLFTGRLKMQRKNEDATPSAGSESEKQKRGVLDNNAQHNL